MQIPYHKGTALGFIPCFKYAAIITYGVAIPVNLNGIGKPKWFKLFQSEGRITL